jgi:hypothetical protein
MRLKYFELFNISVNYLNISILHVHASRIKSHVVMILSLISRKVWICLCLTLNKRSLFACTYFWPALGQTIYLYQTLDYISEEYKDYNIQNCKFVIRRWCGTCCLTLKAEHRLKMLEMREPKKVFLPEGKEITEGWLKLCRPNGELHYL